MQPLLEKKGKTARFITVAALCGLLAALPLCACTAGKLPQSLPVLTETEDGMIEVKPNLKREYPKGDLAPLEIERDTLEYENGYILYPKVLSGTRAEKINAEICGAVRVRAEKMNTQVFTEYRIETNLNGLFSVLFSLLDMNTNELLDVFPVTVDTASGEICGIEYYFEPNSEEWRAALSERAAEEASKQGMTLLKEPAPVTDSRDYFITEGKLVLQYHLFEITTYSGGMPQLGIPIGELEPYLAKNSPLLRPGL